MQNEPTLTGYLLIEHGASTTLGAVKGAREHIINRDGELLTDNEHGIIAKFSTDTPGREYTEDELRQMLTELVELIYEPGKFASADVQIDAGTPRASAYGKLAIRGTAVYVDDAAVAKWLRHQLVAMKAGGDTHVKIELTGYRDEVPTFPPAAE